MVGLLCRREHLSPCRQALQGIPRGQLNSRKDSITQQASHCSPNLKVERAVDSILLCAEDRGKMLSHKCSLPSTAASPARARDCRGRSKAQGSARKKGRLQPARTTFWSREMVDFQKRPRAN